MDILIYLEIYIVCTIILVACLAPSKSRYPKALIWNDVAKGTLNTNLHAIAETRQLGSLASTLYITAMMGHAMQQTGMDNECLSGKEWACSL